MVNETTVRALFKRERPSMKYVALTRTILNLYEHYFKKVKKQDLYKNKDVIIEICKDEERKYLKSKAKKA